MRIYIDGGTKNNGLENQESYIAVWAENKTVIHQGIGNKTSNEAEYHALIEACKWALDKKDKRGFTIYTDSELMKRQIAFEYRINTPHLAPLAKTARELLHKINARLVWRPREENKAGIFLQSTLDI